MIFKSKNKEDDFTWDTNDIIIAFDDDNKTSEIHYISEFRNGALIVDGRLNIPVQDCEVTTGEQGRIYFYRAPEKSIKEVARLAQLEKSMILNQITAYTPPIMPNSIDWVKGLLFGMLFIAMIIIAFVA